MHWRPKISSQKLKTWNSLHIPVKKSWSLHCKAEESVQQGQRGKSKVKVKTDPPPSEQKQAFFLLSPFHSIQVTSLLVGATGSHAAGTFPCPYAEAC